jgi:hypothetical protein
MQVIALVSESRMVVGVIEKLESDRVLRALLLYVEERVKWPAVKVVD